MSKTRGRATKIQIKHVKKEITEIDDDSGNNEFAEIGSHINGHWTKKQSLQLLEIVRQQTNPQDSKPCNYRLDNMDWNKVTKIYYAQTITYLHRNFTFLDQNTE